MVRVVGGPKERRGKLGLRRPALETTRVRLSSSFFRAHSEPTQSFDIFVFEGARSSRTNPCNFEFLCSLRPYSEYSSPFSRGSSTIFSGHSDAQKIRSAVIGDTPRSSFTCPRIISVLLTDKVLSMELSRQ